MYRSAFPACAVTLVVCQWPVTAAACPADAGTAVFEETFSAPALDPCHWHVAEENWGGTLGDEDYNGGVSPANVHVEGGHAILRALGNRYAGPVRGVGSDGQPRPHGRRTGATIVTQRRFLGGRFEARVAIAADLGVCSAMWTYFFEQKAGEEARNHEIDIEFPGRRDIDAPPSFKHVALTTWTGLADGQSTTAFRTLPHPDAEFHTLRFDWLPPTGSSAGRVDYYIDGALLYTAHENVPSEPAPLSLGVWFPQLWAGEPDFDITAMRVDWVRISPLPVELQP